MEYLLGTVFVTRCFEAPNSSPVVMPSPSQGAQGQQTLCDEGSVSGAPYHIAEEEHASCVANSVKVGPLSAAATSKVPMDTLNVTDEADPAPPSHPEPQPRAELPTHRATSTHSLSEGNPITAASAVKDNEKGGNDGVAPPLRPATAAGMASSVASHETDSSSRPRQQHPRPGTGHQLPSYFLPHDGVGNSSPKGLPTHHPVRLEYNVTSRSLLGKYVLVYLPPPRTAADLDGELQAYSGYYGGYGGAVAAAGANRTRSPSLRDIVLPPAYGGGVAGGPPAGLPPYTSPRPGLSWASPSPPPAGKSLARSTGGASHFGISDATGNSAAASLAEDGYRGVSNNNNNGPAPLPHSASTAADSTRRRTTPTQQKLLAFYCLLLEQLKQESDHQRHHEHQRRPQGGDGAAARNANAAAHLSECTTASSPSTGAHTDGGNTIRQLPRRNFVHAPVAVLEIHYAPPVPPYFAFPPDGTSQHPHATGGGNAPTAGAGAGPSTAAMSSPSVGALIHVPGGPLSTSAPNSLSRNGGISASAGGAGLSTLSLPRYGTGEGGALAASGGASSSVDAPMYGRNGSVTLSEPQQQRQQQGGGASSSSPPSPRWGGPFLSLAAPLTSDEHLSTVLKLLADGELETTTSLPDSVVFGRNVMVNPFYGGWMRVESSDAYRRIIQQCEVYHWPAVVLIDPAGNVLTTIGLDHIEAELDYYVAEILRPQQERELHRRQRQLQQMQRQLQQMQAFLTAGKVNVNGDDEQANREASNNSSSEETFDLTIRTRLSKASEPQAVATGSVDLNNNNNNSRSSNNNRNTLGDGSASTDAAVAVGEAEISPSPSLPRSTDVAGQEQRPSPSHSVSVKVGREAEEATRTTTTTASVEAETEPFAHATTTEAPPSEMDSVAVTAGHSSWQQLAHTELREASSVSVNDPHVPTAEPTPVKSAHRPQPLSLLSGGRPQGKATTTARYRNSATPTRAPLSLTASIDGDTPLEDTASDGPPTLEQRLRAGQRQRHRGHRCGQKLDATVSNDDSDGGVPFSASPAPPPTPGLSELAVDMGGRSPILGPAQLPRFVSLFPWNGTVATLEMLSAESARDAASLFCPLTATASSSAQVLESSSGCDGKDRPLPRPTKPSSSTPAGTAAASIATTGTDAEEELTLTATEGKVFRATAPLAASSPMLKVHPMRRLASLALRVGDILDAVEAAGDSFARAEDEEGRTARTRTPRAKRRGSSRTTRDRRRNRQVANAASSPSPQRQDGAVPLDDENESESEDEAEPEAGGSAYSLEEEAGMTWQQQASAKFGRRTTHLICFFGAGWHPSTTRTIASLRRLVDSINDRSSRYEARLMRKVREGGGGRGGGGGGTPTGHHDAALGDCPSCKFTSLLGHAGGGGGGGGGGGNAADSDRLGGSHSGFTLRDLPGGGDGGSLESASLPAHANGGGVGGGSLGGGFGGLNGFCMGGGGDYESSSHDSDQASEDEGRSCFVRVVYLAFDEDIPSLARTLRRMPSDWLCLTSVRLPRAIEKGRAVSMRQLIIELTRTAHEVDSFPRLVVLELPVAAVTRKRIQQYGNSTQTSRMGHEGTGVGDVEDVFEFDDSAYEGIWRVPQDRAELKISADPTGKHFPWAEEKANEPMRALLELTSSAVAAKGSRLRMQDNASAQYSDAGTDQQQCSLHRRSDVSTHDDRADDDETDEDDEERQLSPLLRPCFPPVQPFSAKNPGLRVLLERGGYFVVLCAMGPVESSLHQACLEALHTARTWLYEEIERRKTQLWAAPNLFLRDACPDEEEGLVVPSAVPELLLSDGLRPSPSMSAIARQPLAPTSASTSGAASPRYTGGAGAEAARTGSVFSLGNTLSAMAAADGALPSLPPDHSHPDHISLPSVYFFDAIFSAETGQAGEGGGVLDDAAAGPASPNMTRAGTAGGHAAAQTSARAGASNPPPPPLQPSFDNTDDIRDEHRADLSLLQEYIISSILEQNERQLAAREGEFYLACVRLPDRNTAVLRRKLPSELPPPVTTPAAGHATLATSAAATTAAAAAAAAVRGPASGSPPPIATTPPPPPPPGKAVPQPTSSGPSSSAMHATEVPLSVLHAREEKDEVECVASPSGRVPTAAPISITGPGGFPVGGGGGPSPPTSLSNTVRTDPSAGEKEGSPDPDATPVASAEAVKRFLSEQILSLLYTD